MRIVSCPSSLGSAVESESSRCLEDDMFEEDVMYKYVREEARCDCSLTCHHRSPTKINAMALI